MKLRTILSSSVRSARATLARVTLVSAVALAACQPGGHASLISRDVTADAALVGASAARNDARVVIVTIDGVRWQDVFGGADAALAPGALAPDVIGKPEALMPRTSALVARRGLALGAEMGARGCGVVRTATGANVSLPGYLEIFTGRKPRCRDNLCGPVTEATLLDQVALAGRGPVASIGSWDGLERAVSRGEEDVLVAVGAQAWPGLRPVPGPLEDALEASEGASTPFPGHPRYRPDAQTTAIALAYARSSSAALLHVGLGDTDEWAHKNDYPAYLRALTAADDFIGDLADAIEESGAAANTTVLVTSDHGREHAFRNHGVTHPESARTFLLAFGHTLVPRSNVCLERDVTLTDIAPTVRYLMGLPRDRSEQAGKPIGAIVNAAREAQRAAYRNAGIASLRPASARAR